jgi:hypothetical protein
MEEMGAAAVDEVMAALRGGARGLRQLRYSCRLHERDSVRRLKK